MSLFAKVEATVSEAKTLLARGRKVVVCTCFKSSAQAILQALKSSSWRCELLTGDVPQKERVRRVEVFQTGDADVFIFTCGAGGIGITLTAASDILLVDRALTPGDCEQVIASECIHWC